MKLEINGYHGFRLRLDEGRNKYDYSIGHVYGVDESFFGERISLVISYGKKEQQSNI